MNINKTLVQIIKNSKNNFSKEYSIYLEDIEDFLVNKVTFSQRQQNAISISRWVLIGHNKDSLISCLNELAEIETKIRELEPWVRDHVVHSLLTYILGAVINEDYIKPSYGIAVNNFQWKLAGLLHDVAYPIEIAKNVMKPFNDKINELRSRFGGTQTIIYSILPSNLEILSNNKNGLDLIQKQLETWGLNINAKEEYARIQQSGKICHGINGSLVVLNIIDTMYQRCNPNREYKPCIENGCSWNQKFFDEDIVSACSAIFIHNLPEEVYYNNKINCSKAPLPFLLKLCDCLQDWERPSFNNREGFSADLFDIKIEDGTILFYAPADNKIKLEQSISKCLDTNNIQIVVGK